MFITENSLLFLLLLDFVFLFFHLQGQVIQELRQLDVREVLLNILPITFIIIISISVVTNSSFLLDRSFEQISVPPTERLLSLLLGMASLCHSLGLHYFACLPAHLETALVQRRLFWLICDR